MQDRYFNQGWFGRHPEIYDRTDFFMKHLRKKAAKTLGLKDNQLVIDIATGTGAQGYEFAQLGHTVLGIDIDERMLRQAQKKSDANLFFAHADGTKLPIPPMVFDIGVISFAMHDVPFEIGIKILKEVNRVLKDTGIVYIVEHGDPKQSIAAKILHWISLSFETPNYKPFLKKNLGDYFDESGFRILRKDHLIFGAIRLVTAGKNF